MVGQTIMNNHHASTSTFPPKAVAENVRDLKEDVLTLVRLQLELFRADLEECGHKLWRPMLLLAVTSVVALSCVPLVLVSLALVLQAVTELPLAATLAIIALLGVIGATTAVLYSRRQFHQAATVFRRSEEELQRNIYWLKEVLKRVQNKTKET
jgi:uncharacterized membrane protein YqjE